MSESEPVTRIALIQLCATTDVAANLATSEELIRQAADAGARVILTPEAFAFIGPDKLKREIIEPIPEPTPVLEEEEAAGADRPASTEPATAPILDRCRALARELNVELVLGGHHEIGFTAEKSFNTCVHIGTDGRIRNVYRKIHLFDVQLADGTQLQESARTEPGDDVVVTDTAFGRLGLTICYDIRFPYLYQALVDRGAIAISVPSAFTATTGAAHWHALLRARAIETQCYVLAPAQYGQHNSKRRSYGHSLVIDPWGQIIAEQADGDGVVIADIDPAEVRRVRRELPSLDHRIQLTR
jgi:predicted amidohydrolase